MQQFDLVISAPNDLMEDIRYLEDVIKNINNTFEPRGLSIRPKHWSHATIPGRGVEGQEVVRRQLLDGCDVLIALIGNRLGTPTREHLSGTVDEIMHMLNVDGKLYDNTNVQIYFKDQSIRFDDIDLNEVSRIRVFRDELMRHGIYFGMYQNKEEISTKIAPAIVKCIENFLRNSAKNAVIEFDDTQQLAKDSFTAGSKNNGNSIEKLGILDLAVQFYDNIQNCGVRIENCASVINELNTKMTDAAENINIDMRPIEKYKASNEIADLMTKTSKTINASILDADREISIALSAISQMMTVFYTNHPEMVTVDELLSFIETMNNFVLQTTTSSVHVKTAGEAFKNSPNISANLTTATMLMSISFMNMQRFSDKCTNLANEAISQTKIVLDNKLA